ncbi:MAG TPA: sigma-70 family RNA polymerase sigma factor [Acidimicrobiales bacterium]|nr:sigma-70 family RNA polymerase sigma factor [Acidimicrobiales bacterium]
MAAFSGLSDCELRDRVRDSDQAALAELYRRFSALVFNVALRVTGSRPAAEEVTQTVFVDLWRQPARFDPPGGEMKPWLAAMTHNRSVDWVRSESAGRANKHGSNDEQVDVLPGVEEAVLATLKAERVWLALEQLDTSERTAVCLASFGSGSYQQIARDLGVAEGTITSGIRTGLRHLAAALAPMLPRQLPTSDDAAGPAAIR